MKKYILDFRVVENTKLHDNYALLKLKPDNNEPLPDMLPGQFVEVRVDRSPGTFLRRPISINFVDSTRNELWLLIRKAGEGTRTLCDLKQGDSINLVLPLGNTFSLPDETDSNILLQVTIHREGRIFIHRFGIKNGIVLNNMKQRR